MKVNFHRLEAYLKQGITVLVENKSTVSLTRILSVWDRVLFLNEKLVVLSVLPKPIELNNCLYYRITFSEECNLVSLYYTYEFSDRFRLFSPQHNYGGFLNLVDEGYINLDEALVAWLCG